MSVKEIEVAIARLSDGELAKLATWFEEYLHRSWDRQVGQDLDDNRLETFIKESEEEYEQGRGKPL